MLALTTIGRQMILTQWFARDLADTTADLYVTYTASVPPSNADGSQLDEPVGVGFTRLALPLTSAYWAPSGFGEIFNSWSGPWPSAFSADAGYLSGIALTDSPTIGSGLVIATGMISEPFDARAGTLLQLGVGDITFGLYE